jgi:imidazolonepropionase-like amidohydrolase
MLADKLSKEFDKKIIIKTSGDEYKHIDAIKKLNRQLIVPLVMPKTPNVGDDLNAWNVSLIDMMKWQMSPYNSYFLYKSGIEFALVPAKNKTFLKDLVKAVNKGLPQDIALAALTSTPAGFLNTNKVGNLRIGADANFIIAEKNIFEKGGQINENWIAGRRYEINKISPLQSGIYALTIDGKTEEIELQNKGGKLNIKSTSKDSKIKYKAKISEEFINLSITDAKEDTQLFLGLVEHNAFAHIVGSSKQWQAKRIKDSDKKDKKADKKLPVPIVPQTFSAYGLQSKDTAKSYLITNATVWTGEDEGVLEGTDVYVKNGKIAKIGKNLSVKADKTIDGRGHYLTAGIIDEHSHIALLSVNDIMANSSMVRMEDSLNSDDVNIYRNLSGGVTAAQLLHGSANPIGGQSAMIKMRWGAIGDELLVKGADKFIKFALGENVKRSRSQSSIRYPLTRMGVEQVYRDAFANALSYQKQWQDYNKLSRTAKKKTAAPRRDLMMEATLEVVNKNRFITCHSYVQSEINMLMNVADDFDFNVNTFTHILEGYKVADKMLAHGVGASTFADWWAYKWEVNFAIPYNAAILTKVGVTTAINSDDAEMARRLNQEAAKSVKYGGLTEQQAWAMVTLNPAKLLHLDNRMGSIKVGKNADIVLWNANPLSIYATAQKTFVDGKLLFDRELQSQVEAQIANKRAELIKQINQSDEPKMPASMKPEKHMQCDSLTGYEYLGAAQ